MASERDEVAQGFGFVDHSTMTRLMAARGLHIVTAADKAVLDACAQVSTPALQGLLSIAFFPALWQWAKLELARREAKR